MSHERTGRWIKIAVLSALTMALTIAIAGCGDKASTSSTTTATGDTAMASLEAAQSSLSTMAPDAKLLVVQTAEAVTTTGTPVWAYLFGSPSTDKTFLVYAQSGTSMTAYEYGTAGLSADEWGAVPGTDNWKIDSSVAYEKALAASGATGDPLAYFMGFTTYVPQASESSATPAFTWAVMFDPGESGATTSTIEVNATTGDASIVE